MANTKLDVNDRQRIFGILMVIKELYPDKAGWNVEVFGQIQSLLMEYHPDIKLQHIGFPQNWQEMVKIYS